MWSFTKIPCMEENMQPIMYFVLQQNAVLYRLNAKKYARVVGLRGRVPDVEFQKNPLKGRTDTAYQVICSRRKVPFIIDRSQPNLRVYRSWGTGARCGVSGETLKWKNRYTQQGALFV